MRQLSSFVGLLLVSGCGGLDGQRLQLDPLGIPVPGDRTSCWEVVWACEIVEPAPYFEYLRVELVWNVTKQQFEMVTEQAFGEDANFAHAGRQWTLMTQPEPDVFVSSASNPLELRVSNRGLDAREATLDGPGRGARWNTLPPLTAPVDMLCIAPDWSYNCDATSVGSAGLTGGTARP